MEVLSVLLSPIGKVLHLDLASMQKTRGSVAKVKMQVDLTQLRPHHVWLGFDEDQDVNGDGQWLEVVYEDLPTYCSHCKHLGHEDYSCPIREREEEDKKKVATETPQNKTKQISNNTEGANRIQHQKEQSIPGQHKEQNYNQRVVVQDQNEEQLGKIKTTTHQPINANHSKDQWQSQKKKNFKGINQKNKQEKHKQPYEQMNAKQITTKAQNHGSLTKPQTDTASALGNIAEPSAVTTNIDAAIDGSNDTVHDIPNDQTTPKVVGSQQSLQQLTKPTDQNKIDSTQHVATSEKNLERNGIAEIVTNRKNESDDNGRDQINDK